MNKTEILVVSRDEELLEGIVRQINNNQEWNGFGTLTDEDAIEKFHQVLFDIVLLTTGISEAAQMKLRKLFMHQHPGIIIIQQIDGGKSLLNDLIKQALERHRKESKPSFSFLDDALKNAGLHIMLNKNK